MKKAAFWILASVVLLPAAHSVSFAAAARFRKLSPHFFFLETQTETANTGAVITEEGVLLIDPPPEAEIPAMVTALRAVTSRPVRWVVCTDYQKAGIAGLETFSKQGAAIISSQESDRLAATASGPDRDPDLPRLQPPLNPRFVFGNQLRLFPAGIEVRIVAVKGKARTAGDVMVFLPAEKVLQVGDLYNPARYPDIDNRAGDGNAVGWIDGLKQAIETVPLLKSAMPQPKQELPPSPELEKTLEESVIVVPGHGTSSNLKEMKDLLAVVQKLRTAALRAVALGRTREGFVTSLAPESFGGYGNLETFAGQLFYDVPRK